MLRRLMIAVICASLAGLAPVPLSACAMLTQLPADCWPAAPAAEGKAKVAHCEQMVESATATSNEKAARWAGTAERSCCSLTAAPVPDTSTGANSTVTASAPELSKQSESANLSPVSPEPIPQASQGPIVSPSERQPLLCTFLI